MTEFNTTLLREKFVIRDTMPMSASDREAVTAVSNRIVLTLGTDSGAAAETFVIRSQNMHGCVRLAALISKEYSERGPIMNRNNPFKWDDLWQAVIKGYEKKWNIKRWVAVYHKGRAVYEESAGPRHPFLDIIEQCDARNKGTYEKAIEVAQDAFRQAGKMVTINHDSNVALVMNLKDSEGKSGLIIRAPGRTMTFNIIAAPKDNRRVTPPQLLGLSSMYLEGIQLAFFIGNTKQKITYDLITRESPEAKQCLEAEERIITLNSEIAKMEAAIHVSYRPERPNFKELQDEAQVQARKSLMAELSRRGETGGDWVM